MIARWGLFLILAASSGCGSRYDKLSCPGNPFPESSVILALAPFRNLTYFKGNTNDRSQIDYEIWADTKFEFNVSLQYHYDKALPQGLDCPCAISLLVKHPLSRDRKELGQSFIAFFDSILDSDLTALKTAYSDYANNTPSASHSLTLTHNIIGEVSSLQHVNRGTFLQIGFYERSYYDSHLRARGQ